MSVDVEEVMTAIMGGGSRDELLLSIFLIKILKRLEYHILNYYARPLCRYPPTVGILLSGHLEAV